MPLYLPELLCPAGDESAFRAAIDCGANAVYLGYKAFGARASAVNFDDEALERAVSYAHLHHARVHVTVNTLIKQHELQGVYDALKSIEAAGADAVIVQDAGVAYNNIGLDTVFIKRGLGLKAYHRLVQQHLIEHAAENIAVALAGRGRFNGLGNCAAKAACGSRMLLQNFSSDLRFI